MKSRKLITVFSCLFCFCYCQSMTFAQGSHVVAKPSKISAVSENYIQFSPGFRAEKGKVVSAVILTEIDEESCGLASAKLTGEGNGLDSDLINELNIGIERAKGKQSKFSIYPNPFLNQIAIGVNAIKDSSLRIDIFNVQGQLIRNIVNGNNDFDGYQVFDVDVADLEHGMYFVKIQTNTFSSSRKIIK